MESFMFKNKKANQNKDNIININLWENMYSVELSVENGKDFNYDDVISEKQKEIEKTIENYFIDEYDLENKQILISEFKPITLSYQKNGECVLFGFGPEMGSDEGFALIIKPKLDIMKQYEYLQGLYLEDL